MPTPNTTDDTIDLTGTAPVHVINPDMANLDAVLAKIAFDARTANAGRSPVRVAREPITSVGVDRGMPFIRQVGWRWVVEVAQPS